VPAAGGKGWEGEEGRKAMGKGGPSTEDFFQIRKRGEGGQDNGNGTYSIRRERGGTCPGDNGFSSLLTTTQKTPS